MTPGDRAGQSSAGPYGDAGRLRRIPRAWSCHRHGTRARPLRHLTSQSATIAERLAAIAVVLVLQ
jgi:hypothetical protein